MGRYVFRLLRVNRRLVAPGILLVLLSPGEAVHTQDLGLRAETAAPESANATPRTIAVVPFTNLAGQRDDDWIGVGISETVTADLERYRQLSVVGSERLFDVATAATSNALLLGDEVAARDVARRLGVSWLVTGGFQRLEDELRITARIVNVESGDVVETVEVDGPLNDVFDLQDRVVADLREGLARIDQGESTTSRVTFRPPPSLQPLGEGEGAPEAPRSAPRRQQAPAAPGQHRS